MISPLIKGLKDEFKLVGEDNHVSYYTAGNNTIMSHLSVNESSETNSNPKNPKSDWTGTENNDVEYTLFRNEIIETIEKTKAMNMSERENLTKVKIKKSQKRYLNFANVAIQELFDDIELDMILMQSCMLMQKWFNLNLELNHKRKESLTKIKNQSEKLILKRKLKQWEERCRYLTK